jgi:hypothetical protein
MNEGMNVTKHFMKIKNLKENQINLFQQNGHSMKFLAKTSEKMGATNKLRHAIQNFQQKNWPQL